MPASTRETKDRHRWDPSTGNDCLCGVCGIVRTTTKFGCLTRAEYFYPIEGHRLFIAGRAPACPYTPDPDKLRDALEATRRMLHQHITLVPGKFYRARDWSIWCCYKVEPVMEGARAWCTRLDDNRTMPFAEDGTFGSPRHDYTLVEEVDANDFEGRRVPYSMRPTSSEPAMLGH